MTPDSRPPSKREQFVLLATAMREARLYASRMCITAQRRRDRSRVRLERLLNVREGDRRLAADIAVADQIAQHPRVRWRNRLGAAEADRMPRPRQPVADF